MKKIFAGIIITALILWTQPIFATMSGGDFEITADTISMSDGGEVTGGDYVLESASGETAAGITPTGDYELYAGLMAVAGGGNLSYSLSESSITLDFGSTPLTTIASSSLVLTVTTDSSSGYSASVTEDTDLVSGANDINDVSDGTVTAGSEEYGISTTGSDGQLASDTALEGTVIFASNSGTVSSSETTVKFEAAVSQSSLAGSYSHTVTFTVTANP